MKTTKKLFALFLAFTLLFLTACNNNPADSTTTGTGTDNSQNAGTVNELELKDTIVFSETYDFIDLPSRIVYENGIVYYYSKVDGKAYIYCFDPLCEHSDGYCLANGSSKHALSFGYTFFINNRFYSQTGFGEIISFSFDGTDRKIEYDAEYETSVGGVWGHSFAVGPYLYIELRSYASEDGKPHTLRFNVETGEMEDLTEKTGNYIWPTFFYNGMLYGYNQGSGYLKADLDLNSCEEIERILDNRCYSGSRFLNILKDAEGRYNTYFYDLQTGTTETYEIEGLTADDYIHVLCADENYFYFYKNDEILLGEVWKKGELKPIYKYNDGSIYRVNHDGTGLVCIYEEDEFVIDGQEAIICGDQFLVFGHNVRVRDNQTETWDSGLLVGTIGADGKIDRLDPVEVVE